MLYSHVPKYFLSINYFQKCRNTINLYNYQLNTHKPPNLPIKLKQSENVQMWIYPKSQTFLIFSDSSDSDYSHLYGRGAPGLGNRLSNNLRKFPAKPLFMR